MGGNEWRCQAGVREGGFEKKGVLQTLLLSFYQNKNRRSKQCQQESHELISKKGLLREKNLPLCTMDLLSFSGYTVRKRTETTNFATAKPRKEPAIFLIFLSCLTVAPSFRFFLEVHEDLIITLDKGTSNVLNVTKSYPPTTYYWTVPLILEHSYLVGKLTSSKIADTSRENGFDYDAAIYRMRRYII
jgi:hypothetical protein